MRSATPAKDHGKVTAGRRAAQYLRMSSDPQKYSIEIQAAAIAAYARGDYWDERMKLMTWWADHLDTLRSGARVLQFKGASA
jgi:hypothetical protein